MILLATLVALAYKRGHFSGTLIPSPFQILFVVSIILTIIYVLKEYTIREFFRTLPRKITLAFGCLFFSVVLGWIIGTFFVGISSTHHTILDFGTFTMSIIIFFLVLFYTRDDKDYAIWCLYTLLIPNVYIFHYFFTHGFVGYWGVVNDNSLNGLIDPNLLSKTLLIPALFFMTTALFAYKDKKWWLTAVYSIIAALMSMLIFWTVSRGSLLSLIVGAAVLWLVFSAREFSWKKFFGAGIIISLIFLLGYAMIPHGSKQELHTKIANTGSLPRSSDGKIIDIVNAPTITIEELRETPRTDVRIFEWSYFLKYALRHPFGVGPSSSSVDYQSTDGGLLQLRPGNTYIQVLLWGGLLGLVSFLYIIWSAFVRLWKKWKSIATAKVLALFVILVALSTAIIFDASLYFYWFFIILGLVFGRHEGVENKEL